jgi:Domain of unknown function (DUF4434)
MSTPLLFVSFFVMLTTLVAWPAHGQRMAKTEAFTASLTVIPPAITTPRQLVDIRLGLTNPSAVSQVVTVQFYISVLHPSMRVMPAPHIITLAPGSVTLVSTVWAPVAFQGRQHVLAVLQRAGHPDMHLTWPLQIMPVDGLAAGVPYFAGAWLELGALGFFPLLTITADDIRRVVRRYHERGIRTLIIAYPEFGGCFYYPSTLPLRWHDYTGCAFNSRTYWYECPAGPKVMDPADHAGERCPWVAQFDVLDTILSEAERQGMHVILGLGRSGDLSFSLALEDYYIAARNGIPNLIDPVLLNRRLGQVATVSQAIAGELWARYGHYHSLYGWVLSHEMTCYDVSRNLYDSVAAALKRRTMPDRPVMVTPYAARTCLQPEASIPHHIRESAVDIFLYQDAVGSSAVSPAYQNDPRQRIAELRTEYAELARWHAGTGKHLWASVEVWRASPTWDQRTSLSGPWASEVALQVREAGQQAAALVLNEGLFYMDHGVPALALPAGAKQASAVKLTDEYCEYAAGFIQGLQSPKTGSAGDPRG